MIQDELDVLRDVSQRLSGAGVNFMVTGSVEYIRSRATLLGIADFLEEVLTRNE